ncbi:MAG TPA: DMT family transporter [Anaerolineaceae bacterium]|nr:DMT family transporter [Anaerolineaceae bacterium]
MRRFSGYIFTIISAVSFGIMPILARYAYASGADPITVLFLRFLTAAVLMFAILFVRKIPLPRGRTLFHLFLMGGLGYVGQSMCYFNALTMASASLVSLLLYLYPVLVTVLSAIFLKDKITPVKLAALGLALAGAFLTIGFSSEGTPLGIILGLGAAVIYSVYIVAGSRVMQNVQALPASAVIMASAGLVYGGLAAVRGTVLPSTPGGWLAILGIAVLCTVVAITTFMAGIVRIGPTNAATVSTLEPVVAVVLAGLLLNESLSPLKLAGGALILAAVVILTRAGQRADA